MSDGLCLHYCDEWINEIIIQLQEAIHNMRIGALSERKEGMCSGQNHFVSESVTLTTGFLGEKPVFISYVM